MTCTTVVIVKGNLPLVILITMIVVVVVATIFIAWIVHGGGGIVVVIGYWIIHDQIKFRRGCFFVIWMKFRGCIKIID
jgi:hypothetical protein